MVDDDIHEPTCLPKDDTAVYIGHRNLAFGRILQFLFTIKTRCFEGLMFKKIGLKESCQRHEGETRSWEKERCQQAHVWREANCQRNDIGNFSSH